jgi:hypothetical protein
MVEQAVEGVTLRVRSRLPKVLSRMYGRQRLPVLLTSRYRLAQASESCCSGTSSASVPWRLGSRRTRGSGAYADKGYAGAERG